MGLFSWLKVKARAKTEDSFEHNEDAAIEDFAFTEAVMSGPFVSGNLAMYLIHGSDTNTATFITLEEALEKQKVVIEETGNVSQLKIKNAGDECVFIQSGDIVKGGKQDRTLQHDMILNSRSDFVPINSFCVESGRWCKRGREDMSHFSQSNHYLASKPLRMAAKMGTQGEVWNEVGSLQFRSAANAGVPLSAMQDARSASSLQLTLDSEKIKECTERYVNDLLQVINEKKDVLGCAFAINGEMNSIDVYSSNSLLKKMGPKLIKAAAVEAFAEQKKDQESAPPTISDLIAGMKDLAGSKTDFVAVNGNAKILMQQSPKNVLFETRDLMNGGQWMHRNYTAK